MTLRSEIRELIAAAPQGLTAEQVYAKLPNDSGFTLGQVANNLTVLKSDGKLRSLGMREQRVVYGIADWPEQVARPAAPAPQPKPKPEVKPAKVTDPSGAELVRLMREERDKLEKKMRILDQAIEIMAQA